MLMFKEGKLLVMGAYKSRVSINSIKKYLKKYKKSESFSQ